MRSSFGRSSSISASCRLQSRFPDWSWLSSNRDAARLAPTPKFRDRALHPDVTPTFLSAINPATQTFLSASEFCYDLAINDFAFPQPAPFNIQPATASDLRMNRKQFVILLVALAVIGSAGWVVLNRHKQSWTVREAKVGEKLLPNFPLNDVAALHIKARIDLNIENKDGVWRVRERANYAADYEHIKNLLVRIKDIKVVQSEQ